MGFMSILAPFRKFGQFMFSKTKIPPPRFAPQPEGVDRLTTEQAEPVMEDPEVVAARQEQEERRREKHRKMEAEREKMRQQIRDKYKLKKKEENKGEEIAGRIAGNRKTPEQVALETLADQDDNDGIMAQLGLADTYERAKTSIMNAVTSARNMITIWPR